MFNDNKTTKTITLKIKNMLEDEIYFNLNVEDCFQNSGTQDNPILNINAQNLVTLLTPLLDSRYAKIGNSGTVTTIYQKTFDDLNGIEYTNRVPITQDEGLAKVTFIGEDSIIQKNLLGIVAGDHIRVTLDGFRIASDATTFNRVELNSTASVKNIFQADIVGEKAVIDFLNIDNSDTPYVAIKGSSGIYSIIRSILVEKVQ